MPAAHEDSEFIEHVPCGNCGSSDANSLYTDGHQFCFACNTYTPPDGESASNLQRTPRDPDLINGGEYEALPKRGISQEIVKKFGYKITRFNGKWVQVADVRSIDGSYVAAQKVRFPDKTFVTKGDPKAAGLFGQHLWREKGRRIVITEGEIDAMSVAQAQAGKYPVVSIIGGADNREGTKVVKELSKVLDWLLQYDEIVIMFDNDDAGQISAIAAAQLFPPGRAKIAKIEGFKDANEALVAGKGELIVDAIFAAKTYRPDGIVTLADIREEMMKELVVGLPWWSPTLTSLTHGRRTGEIYMLGAGTGVGKTDFLTQQIDYDINVLREPVATYMLEQEPVETGKRLAGKHAKRRFHIPNAGWTYDELSTSLDALEAGGKLFMYASFGATDWGLIRDRIRFLYHSEGVRVHYVDHLTALAAAEDNEKEALERIMAEMGKLVKEIPIILIVVSHLSTPEHGAHEEGARVTIKNFKGSRAIGFWSHYMFGMERAQQHDDEEVRKTTTFRILKARYDGSKTGSVFYMGYDEDTGSLYEREKPVAEDKKKSAEDYGF